MVHCWCKWCGPLLGALPTEQKRKRYTLCFEDCGTFTPQNQAFDLCTGSRSERTYLHYATSCRNINLLTYILGSPLKNLCCKLQVYAWSSLANNRMLSVERRLGGEESHHVIRIHRCLRNIFIIGLHGVSKCFLFLIETQPKHVIRRHF